jgi:hypothetical protein
MEPTVGSTLAAHESCDALGGRRTDVELSLPESSELLEGHPSCSRIDPQIPPELVLNGRLEPPSLSQTSKRFRASALAGSL